MICRFIKDWLLILNAAWRACEEPGPWNTKENPHPIYGVW